MCKLQSSKFKFNIINNFIIGILGTTFLNDSNDVTTSDQENREDDIKNLEKQYKEERLKRQQMLQMDEVEFASIEFVQYADNIFSAQISPSTLEGKNDDVSIKDGYERAIDGLMLPSEMVGEFKSKGKLDAIESIGFINDFVAKSEHLINISIYGIAYLLEEQELSLLGYYLAEIEFILLNSTEDTVLGNTSIIFCISSGILYRYTLAILTVHTVILCHLDPLLFFSTGAILCSFSIFLIISSVSTDEGSRSKDDFKRFRRSSNCLSSMLYSSIHL